MNDLLPRIWPVSGYWAVFVLHQTEHFSFQVQVFFLSFFSVSLWTGSNLIPWDFSCQSKSKAVHAVSLSALTCQAIALVVFAQFGWSSKHNHMWCVMGRLLRCQFDCAIEPMVVYFVCRAIKETRKGRDKIIQTITWEHILDIFYISEFKVDCDLHIQCVDMTGILY